MKEIDAIIATYLQGLHNPSDDALYNELRAARDTKALKKAILQLLLGELYDADTRLKEEFGEDWLAYRDTRKYELEKEIGNL